MFTPVEKIKNANKIIDFFGKWPSFHDAEMVEVRLNRNGPILEITLYVFSTLAEVDKNGHYKLDRSCFVVMRFSSVEQLELMDFNEQNVIFGIDFENIDSNNIQVNIHPCYGITSTFTCKSIEVISVENKT